MYKLTNKKDNYNFQEVKNKKDRILPYVIVIIIAFTLINIFAYNKIVLKNNLAELTDTDTYMRLVRVEQLAETGAWYDSFIHRSNFPYGEELHWTRPLDVILLAGAYLLKPFQGFQKGLLTWAINISLALGILCLLALLWATKPIMKKNAQRLLMLLFIVQPIILSVFFMGRPDHHSLIILLFILLLGCLFRMTKLPKSLFSAFLAGFIAAVSLWISIENIIPVMMVFITLGVMWLIHGQDYAQELLNFSLSTFSFCLIFLLIERPASALLVIEYDKISIVHIFVLMLSILATYSLTLIKSNKLSHRILNLTLILIACGLAIWAAFPNFYHGPMAEVNKDIYPIWLNKVNETQPLWYAGINNKILIFGETILFFMYLIFLVITKRLKSQFTILLPLISGLAIFLPLTLYMIRMSYYYLIIIIIFLALFLDNIITYINTLKVKKFTQSILRSLIILIFILALPGTGLYFAVSSNNSSDNTGRYNIKALGSFLNEYQINHPDTKTILTFLDFGPELLYRTNYNVIATPYHRNDQGIMFNYLVMAAESNEQAYKMLKERSVDLLILCPESGEKEYYKKTPAMNTFYEQLVSGKKPAFLEEIDLSLELNKIFKVYRIKD